MEIQQKHPEASFIVASALDSPDIKARVERLSVAVFMAKPCQLSRYREEVMSAAPIIGKLAGKNSLSLDNFKSSHPPKETGCDLAV